MVLMSLTETGKERISSVIEGSCIYGVGRMTLHLKVFRVIVSTSSVNSGGLVIGWSFSLDRRLSPLSTKALKLQQLNSPPTTIQRSADY
jgi:hypothetical protein